MAESKGLLDRFNDYIAENHRKRDEESDALTNDVPGMGKRFTKKIISENPNIPQDDVSDYVNNVKDDATDYAMGAGMSGTALGLGSQLEGIAAKLPEVSRFRGLLDSPIVQKIREPFKQQRNIDLTNRATQEMADIARAATPAETKAAPFIDEVTDQRNYKNWVKDTAAHNKELEYHNAQKEIQDAISQQNKLNVTNSTSDATQPGISQELIDNILAKKKVPGNN